MSQGGENIRGRVFSVEMVFNFSPFRSRYPLTLAEWRVEASYPDVDEGAGSEEETDSPASLRSPPLVRYPLVPPPLTAVLFDGVRLHAERGEV
jgi:hypothetical protein